MENTGGHDGEEKELKIDDERFQTDCDAPHFISKLLKDSETTGGRCGPQYGHVPGRQAHEVVWILRRMIQQATEWQFPVLVMDCDVAAAFGHVSHHEIVRATIWIRECRNSETVVELDDIVTPGIYRTRSVTQGDPCAADLFGAAVDRPSGEFVKMCQEMNWSLLVVEVMWASSFFADNCWIIAMSAAELQTLASAWNNLLRQAGLQIDWRKRCGVRRHMTAYQAA